MVSLYGLAFGLALLYVAFTFGYAATMLFIVVVAICFATKISLEA